MNEKFKSSLKIVLSFVFAFSLLYYIYKDQDLSELWIQFTKANFYLLFISFIFAFLSHYIRALRWGMLIKPLGYKVPTINLFNAIMLGYVANCVIPRLGEVMRCGVLMKTDKIELEKTVGTVVVERLVDVLFLGLALALGFCLEFNNLVSFIQSHSNTDSLVKKISILSCIVLVVLGSIWLIWTKFKNKILQIKMIQKIMNGLGSIRYCDNIPLFIFYSASIWCMYYLMMLFTLWALPGTSDVSMSQAYILLIVSTLGMIIPTPGGIGGYHFLVTEGLILYGISRSNGLIFAGISHSLQLVDIVIVALIGLIISSIFSANKSQKI